MGYEKKEKDERDKIKEEENGWVDEQETWSEINNTRWGLRWRKKQVEEKELKEGMEGCGGSWCI